MIERSILEAAAALRATGEDFVIATVVAVTGSAYRRPGARMLVARDRWVAGAVSGGCLEGDIVAKGWWRTEQGSAVVVTYDSTVDADADDDALREGLGLGCNGIVDVLIERADATSSRRGVDAIDFAARCLRDQARGALVTVFRSDVPDLPVGSRAALRADEASTPADATAAPGAGLAVDALVRREDVRVQCREAIASGESRVRAFAVAGGRVDVLIEAVVPPPRLVVLGTGHDAVPVTELGRALGWEVVVCGETANLAARQRFLRADDVVFGAPPELVAIVNAADRAAVVIMNHRYERDAACVAAMLETRASYVGVLGPRRRTAQMFVDGGRSITEAGPRLHAPIGLELASETPAEIALAIVAEIQACLARAPATNLRARVGAIHDAAVDPAVPARPTRGRSQR